MAAMTARKMRRAVSSAGSLRRAGDATGAVDALAPVLAEAPEDPAANVEMARALQLLEDFSGAEEHYRRALAARLEFALVIELAGVVGAQGRIDEANELLDAALQITEREKGLDPGEVHFMRAMMPGDKDAARAALALIGEGSKPQLREYARRLASRLEEPS